MTGEESSRQADHSPTLLDRVGPLRLASIMLAVWGLIVLATLVAMVVIA